jgi:glycosyltransferase involved in cell wall biosynthesis
MCVAAFDHYPVRELLKRRRAMATMPSFVVSASTVLSICGLLRGADKTVATPAEDWTQAQVDVIIPALNEAETIILCLASVFRQTMRPRRIMLIDDGSTDGTIELARAFCRHHGVALTAIRRRKPIGKTPTIKRQARDLDSDVEFILDGDTILESDTYIERTVRELYQAVGIGSAFGTVLPMREKDGRQIRESLEVQDFLSANPTVTSTGRPSVVHRLARGITNLYREVLYLFLQRCVYRGQMVSFGTTTHPVGCAVAYRRKYVKAVFEYVTPILGDDLTNSEDIFIGFAMLNEGYRNIQLADVYARTMEPEAHHLPHQVYLWSSSFFQSCYYFDPLLRSPLKALQRCALESRRVFADAVASPETKWAVPSAALNASVSSGVAVNGFATSSPSTSRPIRTSVIAHPVSQFSGFAASESGLLIEADRRIVAEPYRQAFGRKRTREFGRPAGWTLLLSAIEKIFFPTGLLIMVILEWWTALAVTVAAETAVGVMALFMVMNGRRLEYAAKALAVTPIRYALLVMEMLTIGRFITDLWLTNDRRWRK